MEDVEHVEDVEHEEQSLGWQVTGNLGYPNRSNRGYPTVTGGEQRLTAVTGLRICSGADGTLSVHSKFETARAGKRRAPFEVIFSSVQCPTRLAVLTGAVVLVGQRRRGYRLRGCIASAHQLGRRCCGSEIPV